MTKLTIQNAVAGDLPGIQRILTNYGFGQLEEEGADLISIHPNTIRVPVRADLEKELYDYVGRHLNLFSTPV